MHFSIQYRPDPQLGHQVVSQVSFAIRQLVKWSHPVHLHLNGLCMTLGHLTWR